MRDQADTAVMSVVRRQRRRANQALARDRWLVSTSGKLNIAYISHSWIKKETASLLVSIAVSTLCFVSFASDTTMVHHYEYVVNDGSLTVYDIDALPKVSVVKTKALPNGRGTRGVVACGNTLWVSYGSDNTQRLTNTPTLLAYDLVNDIVKWTHTYSFGIDSMSVTPDCTKIYMPEGELSSGGRWYVIDHHVDRNRGLRDIDAPFEQLTVDLGSAPQRVLKTYSSDQVAHLFADPWSATARTALPSPVRGEARAMPTHNSLGPDDGYGVKNGEDSDDSAFCAAVSRQGRPGTLQFLSPAKPSAL
jgi:hypothetical protein